MAPAAAGCGGGCGGGCCSVLPKLAGGEEGGAWPLVESVVLEIECWNALGDRSRDSSVPATTRPDFKGTCCRRKQEQCYKASD